MKRMLWLTSFVLIAGCDRPAAITKDQYEVRRESSSGFCRIDLTTAAPAGDTLTGPFETKKAACESARDKYDGSGTDSRSCSDYLTGSVTMCRGEGVKLPGSKLLMRDPALLPAKTAVDVKVIGGGPADPAKWPATRFFSSSQGDCTSTIVGDKVVLTSAHCVANGAQASIELPAGTVAMTCKHHPRYAAEPQSYDVALCVAKASFGSGFTFETVNKDPTALGTKPAVTILGYGCTVQGGDIGGLYVGSTALDILPTAADPKYRLKGGAVGCSGDSGGGGYTSARLLIGVMKGVDIPNKYTYQVSTSAPEVLKFLSDEGNAQGVHICGVHNTAKNCHR